MGRSDEVRGSDRAAALPDLPTRLRRAVEGLDGTADLSEALRRLLTVVGEGTGLERALLVADGDEPRELAAHPAPAASAIEAPGLASLVRRATAQRVVASQSASTATASDPSPPDRSRHAVPLISEGAVLAVLVGETGPGTPLETAEEVVVETMASLLVPLLLVRRQLADARELDRLRSDFIARVSHELRTPLTIITGFAGTLGAHEETLSTEQRHAMLDRIVTASIRLEHLIEEVLSLASVDAGLADPDPKVVPVRDVVDLAVHDRGGSDRVEVRGDERLELRTDPEVARVVLGALIENALEHGDKVAVLLEASDLGVRISVEDDGPGVPPELAPRIFERFVRGHDRSPGMGLGLAIARRMAEIIGARLWLDDAEVGARFVVEVPSLP